MSLYLRSTSEPERVPAAAEATAANKPPAFMMIPRWLSRKRGIPAQAKILYCRLRLFAGRNGLCNPSHATLAAEIGCSDRHVRNLLSKLHGAGLVRWRRTRSSSRFVLYEPEDLDNNVQWTLREVAFVEAQHRNCNSGQDRKGTSEQERNNTSDKNMSFNRGLLKEKEIDLDYLPANRTDRDLQAGIDESPVTGDIRSALQAYMDRPVSERVVQEIAFTCRNKPRSQTLEVLERLNNRSVRSGKPAQFEKWWIVAVQNEVNENRRYELPPVASPTRHCSGDHLNAMNAFADSFFDPDSVEFETGEASA